MYCIRNVSYYTCKLQRMNLYLLLRSVQKYSSDLFQGSPFSLNQFLSVNRYHSYFKLLGIKRFQAHMQFSQTYPLLPSPQRGNRELVVEYDFKGQFSNKTRPVETLFLITCPMIPEDPNLKSGYTALAIPCRKAFRSLSIQTK